MRAGVLWRSLAYLGFIALGNGPPRAVMQADEPEEPAMNEDWPLFYICNEPFRLGPDGLYHSVDWTNARVSKERIEAENLPVSKHVVVAVNGRGHVRVEADTMLYALGRDVPQTLSFPDLERGERRGFLHVVDAEQALVGGVLGDEIEWDKGSGPLPKGWSFGFEAFRERYLRYRRCRRLMNLEIENIDRDRG